MQKGFSHALVKKEAYSQLNYPTKGIRDCPLRLEKVLSIAFFLP